MLLCIQAENNNQQTVYQGQRGVKSEARQDSEIRIKNPRLRLLGKKFRDSKKSRNKPCKSETSRLIKSTFKIVKSCQNFLRPTFFEVPFSTPCTARNFMQCSTCPVHITAILLCFKIGEKKQLHIAKKIFITCVFGQLPSSQKFVSSVSQNQFPLRFLWQSKRLGSVMFVERCRKSNLCFSSSKSFSF